ncbi:restriction endonuclease subunit S [Auritidibacter ignavus]|uniref:restriction endonuclease subunit S n=1 Tax=Auritidibacter ignavus TaxID=678932 RepID=UPI00109CD0ED|nr:restriction endonuclease subunit S [Auritidibacter ignavus]
MRWRRVALKDVGEIIGGGTPPTKEPANFGDEYSWITPKDLSRQKSRFVEQGERSLSKVGLANSSAKLLPAGTVIISSRAPIGLTSIARVPLATNQGCRNFIPSDEVDSLFMYYKLGSMTEEFERRANGSTFKEISGSTLGAIEIDLPSVLEQRAIATTLGALDDKIESNRQVCNHILQLAENLFVKALEQGRWVTSVGDVATFHNHRRGPLSRNERSRRVGEIPYYGATGVFGYVDEALFDQVLVLVGEDGSVVRDDGGPVLQYIWGPAWINNHAHALTARTISNETLFIALNRADIRPIVTGAVQPKVNMGNLKSLSLELPKWVEDLQVELTRLFELYRVRRSENLRLGRLRDTLLPELLSGRIRVPVEGADV